MLHFNGVSLIPGKWSQEDVILSVDAYLTGAGGKCENEFVHRVFPDKVKQEIKDIDQREIMRKKVTQWKIKIIVR